jgi:endonuclease/exonuclease/phosphatase family metal-dependent hydrolase
MAAASTPVTARAPAGSRPPVPGCGIVLVAAVFAAVASTVAGCAPLPPAPDSSPIASLPCRQVSPPSAQVVWWSAVRDRDRDDLTRWCETVGPVLFEPSGARSGAAAADTLVLVSWNVHVGTGDVDALIRALRAGEFTAGKRVDDFVLLLQEAYRRDAAIPVRVHPNYPVPSRIAARRGRGPDVAHLWRDAGLALFYAPSMRNGFTDVEREDRGNAIASTLALQQPTVVELPLEHQRRVVAVAVVEGRTSAGTPWTVRVADVHLDTAVALTHGGPFAARRRQAEALVAGLAATAPKADVLTTVVAGDFNTLMGSRESAIGYLRRAFPDGPAPPDETTFQGPLGFHATLDHVFVGGPVKAVDVRRLPSRFGSDHYPLLATISF